MKVSKYCSSLNKVMSEISNRCHLFLSNPCTIGGTKGDCDFRISDLVKYPDGTDNPCGEFLLRAQLAKSTLLAYTLVPLGTFKIFKGLFRC